MSISPVCRKVLRLSSVTGLGLKRFYELLRFAGSVDSLFSGQHVCEIQKGISPALWRGLEPVLAGRPCPNEDAYGEVLELWLEGCPSRHVVCIEDDAYPPQLREIFCPPPALYVQGELSALAKPSLAVVGSRKASLAGLRHTQLFAGEMARLGVCITSGLALGVDGAAHRAALQSGGVTSAVLGTGLDRIYPRQHIALANEITEHGVLVSEMKLGTPPRPHHFPRRNRVVSGLSEGVLVVEAGIKSGSLISARFALEQNRQVFAIPSSIENIHAQGCHYLIKQGASLVDCVEDLLEGLNIGSGNVAKSNTHKPIDVDEEEGRLLALIGAECVSFDFLVQQTSDEVEYLMQRLLILEVKGLVAQVPGGYQALKPVNSQ